MGSGFTTKDTIEQGFLIGGIIAGIWYMVKKHISGKTDTTCVKNPIGMDRDSRVHDMLVELRTETRADRVQIFQFHNGEFYDTAISIKRFSCSHEVLKTGVSSALKSYQACLVSGYIDGLRVFIDSDKSVSKLLFSDLDNGLYKSTMISSGVNVQVGIPLKGLVKGEQRIMGLLILSYNDERDLKQCSFDSLFDEGRLQDTDTHEMIERSCNGSCADCRFGKYITILETELQKVN